MMVLFVINTPGGNRKDSGTALIPLDQVSQYPLDAMNHKIVNVDDTIDSGAFDAIVELYHRLGLESNKGQKADLKKYMNPKAPFTVDKVVSIGWSV